MYLVKYGGFTMKTLKKCLLVVAFFISIILTQLFVHNAFADSDIVTFADPNLEAVVRGAINKPTGDILKTDVSSITSIIAENKNINNLTGIECLTNLTMLSLSKNKISDVTPLAGLTSLKYLALYQSNISNINALAGLINLEYLDLGMNSVSDISFLKNMTKLTYLELSWNNITDISALSKLTNLQYLQLGCNRIVDISPISNLTKLKTLHLFYNRISDISGLSGLKTLTYLHLNSNNVSNINPLNGLTMLSYLDLGFNKITDISALNNLTKITDLDLSYNKITNINVLSNLTSLNDLKLENNPINNYSPITGIISKLTKKDFNLEPISFPDADLAKAVCHQLGKNSEDMIYKIEAPQITVLDAGNMEIKSLSGIEQLCNLKDLYLAGNELDNINPISALTSLEALNLEKNQISDLNVLRNLHNLKYLILRDNKISDITPLSDLSSLKTLDLSYNSLTNTKNLSKLVNLYELHLDDNEINDINGLQNITKLKILTLDKNQIQDVCLLKNKLDLISLCLRNNLISDISCIKNLPKLVDLFLLPNPIQDFSPAKGIYSNLMNKDFELNAVASVTISGSDIVTVKNGSGTSQYTAVVKDNNNIVLSCESVTWSLDNPVSGVVIDSQTGIVSVDSTAKAGCFTIKATNGSIEGTFVATLSVILPDKRIISGRISLNDKAPIGGVNISINAGGNGHSYGVGITIDEGESSKDFALPVSASSGGLTYTVFCTARAGDAIGFIAGSQVDVSDGNVSNVNMQISSFLQPVYRNVSGTVSFSKGVAPKGGLTLIVESSTTINERITKECYSSVTIPEGMNSAKYAIPIITYAGYPCSLIIKETSRDYWGSQLDLSSGDITGLDAQIVYPLNTTETRNVSGTIYLSTGVAPKGGIIITWYSSSGSYTNSSFVTIPEGLNAIKYDATFVTDTSKQTVLRFVPDKAYKQYSFFVENSHLVKDITLEEIAPQLTGFTWEKGKTEGSTKATVVPAGTLKYIVGVEGSQVQPNVGDAATAYTDILSANTDIAVSAGQHIFIIRVGNDGNIASWADVAVSESNINLGRIQGDVNNDSVVDALDFALMKIYLLGGTANINEINSDINLDGEINAIDFALLKMQLLN